MRTFSNAYECLNKRVSPFCILFVCVSPLCVPIAVLQTFRDLVWFCPQSSTPICKAVEGCDESPQDDEVRKDSTDVYTRHLHFTETWKGSGEFALIFPYQLFPGGWQSGHLTAGMQVNRVHGAEKCPALM